MHLMSYKRPSKKLCFVVTSFFVLLNPSLLSVLGDGASCRVDGIAGEYVPYSVCQQRRGVILQTQLRERPRSAHEQRGIVCCGITRRQAEKNSPLNSLQKDEISAEIETISELKQILENPKYQEPERRKHSIDPADSPRRNEGRESERGNNLIHEISKSNADRYPPRFDVYTSTTRSYPLISPFPDRQHALSRRTTTHKTTRRKNIQWEYSTVPTSFDDYNSFPTRKPVYSGNGGQSNSFHQKEPEGQGPCDGRECSTRRPAGTASPRPRPTRREPQPLTEDPLVYPIYPTIPITSTRAPHRHTHTLRLSERKCKEYSEVVQDTIAGLPLLANPQPFEVNIDRCNYNAQQLIVGGQNASLGEFPHMVAIGFMDERRKNIFWNCGGSLISENFVLTAAHCTTSRLGAPALVRLGEHNLKRDDDGAHPAQYFVKEVIRHPEYRAHSRYHDIALLRLSRHVTFTQHIRPACLYQRSTFNTGKTVAAGWGRMAYHEEQSDTLLKVVLSIIDNGQCNRLYRAESSTDVLNRGITDQQMCAGELNGGKDTCQGDSGGPIEVTSAGNQCVHHIIGITSFGKKCGQPNAPGVYTRVSSYVDWIESVVWPQQ